MFKMNLKRDFGCGIRKAYVLLRVNNYSTLNHEHNLVEESRPYTYVHHNYVKGDSIFC